jgi:hypothetical protein
LKRDSFESSIELENFNARFDITENNKNNNNAKLVTNDRLIAERFQIQGKYLSLRKGYNDKISFMDLQMVKRHLNSFDFNIELICTDHSNLCAGD